MGIIGPFLVSVRLSSAAGLSTGVALGYVVCAHAHTALAHCYCSFLDVQLAYIHPDGLDLIIVLLYTCLYHYFRNITREGLLLY